MKFHTAKSGLYVALEGIDTSGKSTQIQALSGIYPHAIITKEPGGSHIGQHIRDIIFQANNLSRICEFFLFLSDRAQHYHEVLKPNLDSNKLIISDRSLLSGIAYAKDIPQALSYNHTSTQGLKPHLCVLLTLDEKTLTERLARKKHDNIEKRGIAYMLEIQERLCFFSAKLDIQTLQINAASPKDEITKQIIKAIDICYQDSKDT